MGGAEKRSKKPTSLQDSPTKGIKGRLPAISDRRSKKREKAKKKEERGRQIGVMPIVRER